jgi:cell division protein FtsL
MTQFATVMMICWGVLVVVTGALMLYRAKLQGNETDVVSLDETFAREREENEAIAAKVNKIQPAIRILGWVLAAATLIVIVYWFMDFIKQFK